MRVIFGYILFLMILICNSANAQEQFRVDENSDICNCYTYQDQVIASDEKLNRCLDGYREQLNTALSNLSEEESQKYANKRMIALMTNLIQKCDQYQLDFFNTIDIYSNESIKAEFLNSYSLDVLLDNVNSQDNQSNGLTNLSEYYYYTGAIDKAKELLDSALALTPKDNYPNMIKCMRYVHEMNINEGINQCEYIINMYSNDNDDYVKMIKVYLESQKEY